MIFLICIKNEQDNQHLKVFLKTLFKLGENFYLSEKEDFVQELLFVVLCSIHPDKDRHQ